MDPDPGGPITSRSGSPTLLTERSLFYCIEKNIKNTFFAPLFAGDPCLFMPKTVQWGTGTYPLPRGGNHKEKKSIG
jgi:hypothetical protein